MQDINSYIESEDFSIEYRDKDNNIIDDESCAVVKRFILPYKDRSGENVYGVFSRENINKGFIGVVWQTASIVNFKRYGSIRNNSVERINDLSGNKNVTENNIFASIVGKEEYFNGAGYKKFPNGTDVTKETGKFIRFRTNLKTKSGEILFLWFTKNAKGSYEGLNCGDEATFRQALSNRQKFFVGRMSFESIEVCNEFLNELAKDLMEEPWNYKNRKDSNFDHPILKSYLEHELGRLFLRTRRVGNIG